MRTKHAFIATAWILFSPGSTPLTGAFFGRGDGPIYLSNVQCTGSEDRLSECPNSGLNVIGQCTHALDSGLRCSEGTAAGLGS